MLNLKKTAVAVLAFGSSAVFAGSMGPVCSAVNVTVPCEATAWEFAGKALYLKPQTGSNSGFSPVFESNLVDHAPNYNWGFQIEGAYHFSTGNDLNINWYHLSRSSDRTIGAQPTSTFTSPLLSAPITSTVNTASLSVDPKWDAVNIEVGQHVDFGDNKAIRFHGGAQYARLANDTDSSSSITFTSPVAGTFTQALDYNHTYNGFGPRLGMDMSFDWGNGLGIYANGATAILAGTRSHSFAYSDAVDGVAGNVVTGNLSRTAIVPAVDAKLGATYTYAMPQGDLTVDAGWMWVNYFNARSNVAGDVSDFGLQGPFVGLKWMGNIA